MAVLHHGGDIYRNRVELDFSVSVNPYPLPERVKEAMKRALERAGEYPDIRQERLRAAIASHHGIVPGQVVCGNGASELLMALFHAIRPAYTIIRKPEYGGYRRAAEAVGSVVIAAREDRHTDAVPQDNTQQPAKHTEKRKNTVTPEDGTQIYIFSCPNNPTGALPPIEWLAGRLTECRGQGQWLVVDASFIDLTEQAGAYWKTLVSAFRSYPRCVILYSMTKTYAIPGIRLGYLLCQEETAEQITAQLSEWNVSVVAEETGIACLTEREYLASCVAAIHEEKARLETAFRQMGLVVEPSSANFLCIHTPIDLYEPLLKKGILIRDCAGLGGLEARFHHYRIAVRTPEENARLIRELEGLL